MGPEATIRFHLSGIHIRAKPVRPRNGRPIRLRLPCWPTAKFPSSSEIAAPCRRQMSQVSVWWHEWPAGPLPQWESQRRLEAVSASGARHQKHPFGRPGNLWHRSRRCRCQPADVTCCSLERPAQTIVPTTILQRTCRAASNRRRLSTWWRNDNNLGLRVRSPDKRRALQRRITAISSAIRPLHGRDGLQCRADDALRGIRLVQKRTPEARPRDAGSHRVRHVVDAEALAVLGETLGKPKQRRIESRRAPSDGFAVNCNVCPGLQLWWSAIAPPDPGGKFGRYRASTPSVRT